MQLAFLLVAGRKQPNMCGICGLVTPQRDSVEPSIECMTRQMHHRGPDDYGFLVDGDVGLGIARLSIIDLVTGHQPIASEDETIWIVLNGEIYNYRELTRGLEGKGHRFATRSDAEAVIHLYEEYGTNCLSYLRGMFAFAIWDSRTQTLFVARDRLGIKPLYYWQEGDRLAFASEVRALLASGLIPRTLSLAGLRSYLAFGSVQEPLTMVEGVRSLPPGHFMTVRGGKMRWGCYWQPPAGTRVVDASQIAHEKERTHALLEESVRLRLVSDVPLGAFLSGGIDSGMVVGLMSRMVAEPIRTFTISFGEQAYDEGKLAAATARRWKTKHERIVINLDQVLNDLPQALAAMDQPTGDGINTWYVSRAVRQAGITVALSGLGGDELFAGYHTFRDLPHLLWLSPHLQRLPAPLRSVGGALACRLLPDNDRRRKLQAFLTGDVHFSHPYFTHRAMFTPAQERSLLRSEVLAEVPGLDTWLSRMAEDMMRAATYDPVGAVSYLELRHYMLCTLLRDTDCMSMAHSLEVRVPFLDHLLVEQVIGLPGKLKVKGKGPKPLLVSAMDGILPPEVAQGSKRTFTFPWAIWLRGALKSEVESVLFSRNGVLEGILSSGGVARLWQDFLEGRVSWARIWALYVLKSWCAAQLSPLH